MEWFNNLQVKHKLTILIAVFVFAIIGVAVTGSLDLKQSSSLMNQLFTTNVKQIQSAYKSKILLHQTIEDVYGLMITTEDSENQRLKNGLIAKRKELDENLSAYEQLSLTSTQMNEMNEMKDALQKFRTANNQVIDLATQNKKQEAYDFSQKEAAPLLNNVMSALDKVADNSDQGCVEMNETGKAEISHAIWTFIIITLVAIFLGVGIGILTIKQIGNKVKMTVDFLIHLADGNFSFNIQEQSMQDKS